MWCVMEPTGPWWPVCLRARPGAENTLESNGIDAEGSEIILRREIQAGGKGRVYVNNQPATVNVLRQLAPELALVHAQSETMGSFDQAQQRQLLDRSAGISTERVAAAFQEWSEICARLSRLEGDEQARLREADLWSFQKNEIESAAIREKEDEELEIERRVLANAEKLLAAAMSAHELLYESDRSAEAALRAALEKSGRACALRSAVCRGGAAGEVRARRGGRCKRHRAGLCIQDSGLARPAGGIGRSPGGTESPEAKIWIDAWRRCWLMGRRWPRSWRRSRTATSCCSSCGRTRRKAADAYRAGGCGTDRGAHRRGR